MTSNVVAGACFGLIQSSLCSLRNAPSDKVFAPTHCGSGHELTPENLVLAECGTRRRCRQCEIERATAWRRRHYAAA